MNIVDILKRNWIIIVYLALSVFTILPFFEPGFFNIHDNTQIERVYQMSKSLADGMIPVRWVADLGYGYGYAIFNFYSVLPYYIGGLLVLLGFNALLSTKIIFAAAIVLSGAAMYSLVKKYFGALPALTAGSVYLYFPYHAVNVYVRGDLAELFAYAFIPFVFLGLYGIHKKIIKSENPALYILIFSISVAAVILSHNLSAFMLFIFVFIFVIYLITTSKNRKNLTLYFAGSLFIAFLLSAFYSIPAVIEMTYSNVLSVVGGGSDFRDHYVCLGQLWNSEWGYGGSAPGCLDGMSFKLGKTNILLAILGIASIFLLFKKTKNNRKLILFGVSGFLLSIFLTLGVSKLLWMLPFMDFLQFPWRFLNFVGFFVSLLVGVFIWLIAKKFGNKIAIAATFITIAITVYYNQPLFSSQKNIDLDSNSYIQKEHLNWTVSKISDEYLPHNFSKPKTEKDIPVKKVEIVKGDGDVEITSSRTNNINASINMQSKGEVRINTAYFPAWNIYVNNNKSSYIIRNDGMYILLTEGMHNLEVKFEETLIEKVANILTIIGVIMVFAVIIIKPKIKSNE